MISQAKKVAWRFIARNRRSSVVRLLHRFEGFVHQAYGNVGLDLELNGEYEVIRRLRDAQPKVVFDVGANCGDWLMEALQVWKNCHCHAFEVVPETFRQLSDRVQQSGYDSRVSPNCFGLSNVDGKTVMYFVPEYPNLTTGLELARPLHFADNYVAVPFEAVMWTGDRYVADRQIEAVDFLKIDVEGGEYPVLQGFQDCLTQSKVHCLQFEYSPVAIQTKFLLVDFYSLLSERYWLGKVYPNYVEFKDYEWSMENFEYANYCAVSKLRPDLREMLS